MIIYIKNYYRYKNFNGPLSLPFIGNLYDIEIFKNIKFLKKLHNKFGNIFKFYIFNDIYLVITEPKIVKSILSNTKLFYKGNEYKNRIGYCFGEGLITSNGIKHYNDKIIFMRYFTTSHILKNINIFNDIANEIINDLDKNIGHQNNISLNIENIFALYTLRSILKFGFDTKYTNNIIEQKLCNIISHGSLLVGEISYIKLPLLKIFPNVKKLDEYILFVKKEFEKILFNYKNNNKFGENFIQLMLDNNFQLKDMEDHFITLLCAGQDTTSYFLAYTCYLLSKNQDIQDKLRNQIKNFDTYQNFEQILNCKYLNNVFSESLRLFTIVPNITRISDSDVYFDEFNIKIPKNTTVLIPTYLLNRNEKIWDNPNIFNPDRFNNIENNNSFYPFGYGNRVCSGQYYSKIISSIILIKILKKYKILEIILFKPDILSGISLTTKNGIHVELLSI